MAHAFCELCRKGGAVFRKLPILVYPAQALRSNVPLSISFPLIHLIIYLDPYGTDVVTFSLTVALQPVRSALHPHFSPSTLLAAHSPQFSPSISPLFSGSSALFHFPYPVSPVFATLTKTTGVYTNSSHFWNSTLTTATLYSTGAFTSRRSDVWTFRRSLRCPPIPLPHYL